MIQFDYHQESQQSVFTSPKWRGQAACASEPEAKDLFFSDDLGDISDAKRICSECPVMAPCLEAALERSEPCGVWGGQLFERGLVVAVKRRRGRPRKEPRPEDLMIQVTVPAHLQQLIA